MPRSTTVLDRPHTLFFVADGSSRPSSSGTACEGAPQATPTRPEFPFLAYGIWLIAGSLLTLIAMAWRAKRTEPGQGHGPSTPDTEALRRQLIAAERRLERFVTTQERFVASIAEELQTPLSVASTHAEALRTAAYAPASARSHAAIVCSELRHLTTLLESFLLLTRPSTADDRSHHLPAHFQDLVVEAVRRAQTLAALRSVSVVPMLPDPEQASSVEVLGDAVLLQAMVENLVRNAVLSSPAGTRVDLQVQLTGDAIVLSVRDLGARIDEAQIETVFGGLYQTAEPPRSFSGTGIGLAIAKRVAEQHRGKMRLRNVPDGGCEFEVTLPRWLPDDHS
jgi:signal transduction histidine kinase